MPGRALRRAVLAQRALAAGRRGARARRPRPQPDRGRTRRHRRRTRGARPSRATLEGHIIRFVDRIAYINHDIDDAVRAGVLDAAELPRGADRDPRRQRLAADRHARPRPGRAVGAGRGDRAERAGRAARCRSCATSCSSTSTSARRSTQEREKIKVGGAGRCSTTSATTRSRSPTRSRTATLVAPRHRPHRRDDRPLRGGAVRGARRSDGVHAVSRYTADSRDRVRDAVDMLALVGSKVELTRRGRRQLLRLLSVPRRAHRRRSTCAPTRSTTTASAARSRATRSTFVMQTEGLDFKGALESLADRFGVKLETEEESPEAASRAPATGAPVRAARSRARPSTSATCGRRRRPSRRASTCGSAASSEEMLREFRVGLRAAVLGSARGGVAARPATAPRSCWRPTWAGARRQRPDELLDRFRGRLMFPTADARGRVRGFGARTMGGDDGPKYLNTAEGEVYRKREVLYGIAQARPAAAREGRMILCEGYTDVLALHQAGVRNAVGIMGTSLTDEQVAELVRVGQASLELCLDADNAGQRAMERAAKVCADSGLELRVVPLPARRRPRRADRAARARPRCASGSPPRCPTSSSRSSACSTRADLSTAEGKDRAIAELRPVMAARAGQRAARRARPQGRGSAGGPGGAAGDAARTGAAGCAAAPAARRPVRRSRLVAGRAAAGERTLPAAPRVRALVPGDVRGIARPRRRGARPDRPGCAAARRRSYGARRASSAPTCRARCRTRPVTTPS